jgi:hypothetical protein
VSQLQPDALEPAADPGLVHALAEETHTAPDIVKALYDEEVAALTAEATVTAEHDSAAETHVTLTMRARAPTGKLVTAPQSKPR